MDDFGLIFIIIIFLGVIMAVLGCENSDGEFQVLDCCYSEPFERSLPFSPSSHGEYVKKRFFFPFNKKKKIIMSPIRLILYLVHKKIKNTTKLNYVILFIIFVEDYYVALVSDLKIGHESNKLIETELISDYLNGELGGNEVCFFVFVAENFLY